jgi:hypothetical protein
LPAARFPTQISVPPASAGSLPADGNRIDPAQSPASILRCSIASTHVAAKRQHARSGAISHLFLQARLHIDCWLHMQLFAARIHALIQASPVFRKLVRTRVIALLFIVTGPPHDPSRFPA